jgi:NAD(P)-dependent dehydrogenase (short-subunit alcohol dehydrogenase family)
VSLFDLTGKVAVVTGATKGIGLGVAEEMAAQGAKLIVSSRDQALCDQVAADLDARYGKGQQIAKGIACDIDDLGSIARLAKTAPEAWGGVDILVCNAAILPFIGPSKDTPPELFDRILIGNIHHNFRLCQALRPQMAARGGGSMVLIGSEAGHTSSPMVLAYAVAKAGVAHMARCLADEMAGEKIRVNCVAPGLIRSYSSSKTLGDDGLAKIGAGLPLGRVGEPKDIAGAVIYLSSEAGSHVTGSAIIVDGGRAYLSTQGSNSLDEVKPGTSYN